VEELLEKVETAALESGYDLKNLPLVGVITGGGSAMAGMDLLTMNILGLKDVRRGRISRDLIHAPEEFLTPEYSTAIALALYVNKTNNYENYYNTKTDGTGFGKIGKWVKSILGY
jgi:cell division ATPase FtsA